MADYYKRLNIEKDASKDEIKRAFRKEAMRAHPDKGGSHTEMRKLNKMYKTLTDSKKRKRYNQTLDGKKRVKVVPINKPPRPTANQHYSSTWEAGHHLWEDQAARRSESRRATKPRPDKLKEEDLSMLWGKKGAPGKALAKPIMNYMVRGANTKVLKEAQDTLAAIKKKKPLMGKMVDTAYLQLGQIISIIQRGKNNA